MIFLATSRMEDPSDSKAFGRLGFWWAARVSIPAPWECFQNVQWRLSTSKFTGWMEWNVHQRPQKSSLV